MKPIIVVSADVHGDRLDPRTGGTVTLNWNYAEAIERAGGVPLIIPPVADAEAVATIADGWMIPGGDDLDSVHFGQPLHPACKLQDPARFAAESELYRCLPSGLPVLGICYGMQLLNVLRGGTLIQHLPDQVGHEAHSDGTPQPVRVDPGARLFEATGYSLEGSSHHHQAAGDLGRDLQISARADDGTIEAIEDPSHPFFVAVQWHPERTPDSPASRGLFRAFVAAAQLYRDRR